MPASLILLLLLLLCTASIAVTTNAALQPDCSHGLCMSAAFAIKTGKQIQDTALDNNGPAGAASKHSRKLQQPGWSFSSCEFTP
jgi:mannose/fructose/N-acetylgalactosamine-specific phosphotransferase system component IIC